MNSSNQDNNENNNNSVILATGGYDNSIRFWSVHSGAHAIRVIPQIEPHINAMEITPDRTFLAVATYQHIKFYDVMCKVTNSIINFEGVTKNVTSVGFNSDGRWMYSGGEDGYCRVWDLKAPYQCQQKCQAENSAVNTAFLHPNQYEIYCGDQNGQIYIWDLRSNKSESILVDNDIAINHLSIEPEGNCLACVDNKGNCYTFSLNLKYSNNTIGQVEPVQRKLKLKAHKKYTLKCKFSPDSTLLATTSADQTAKIWRTADLLPLNEISDSETSSISSPLNSTWPLTEKISHLSLLTAPDIGWLWDCSFSADSQYIFTASSDGKARLWNVATGEVGREYTGHQRVITSLSLADQLVD